MLPISSRRIQAETMKASAPGPETSDSQKRLRELKGERQVTLTQAHKILSTVSVHTFSTTAEPLELLTKTSRESLLSLHLEMMGSFAYIQGKLEKPVRREAGSLVPVLVSKCLC